MTTRNLGRHRAAVRPKTPLTALSEAVSASAGTVGRRSAVIAASSGLVVTMGLPAANATPFGDGAEDEAPPAEPTAAPVAEEAAAPVTVPADAQVSFARAGSSTVTPPPPPPPPPPVAVEDDEESDERSASAEPASRDAERESVSVPESSEGGSIVSIAMRYIGTPYVYGGTTPSGFDCSGFTSYVYAQVGIDLPRTSGAQRSAGTVVSASEARPGDLVWKPGHIGIYAGDGMMIDSPSSGKSVSHREIWFSNPTFLRF